MPITTKRLLTAESFWNDALKEDDAKMAVSLMIKAVLIANHIPFADLAKELFIRQESLSGVLKTGLSPAHYDTTLKFLRRQIDGNIKEPWFTREKYDEIEKRMNKVKERLPISTQPDTKVKPNPPQPKQLVAKSSAINEIKEEIKNRIFEYSGLTSNAPILQMKINEAAKEYADKAGKRQNIKEIQISRDDAKALIEGEYVPSREILAVLDYMFAKKYFVTIRKPYATSLVEMYVAKEAQILEEWRDQQLPMNKVKERLPISTQPDTKVKPNPPQPKQLVAKSSAINEIKEEIKNRIFEYSGLTSNAPILQMKINEAAKEYADKAGKRQNIKEIQISRDDAKALIEGEYVPSREILAVLDYMFAKKYFVTIRKPYATSLVEMYVAKEAQILEEWRDQQLPIKDIQPEAAGVLR